MKSNSLSNFKTRMRNWAPDILKRGIANLPEFFASALAGSNSSQDKPPKTQRMGKAGKLQLLLLGGNFKNSDSVEDYCEHQLVADAKVAGFQVPKHKLFYFFGSAEELQQELRECLYSSSFYSAIVDELEDVKDVNALVIVFATNAKLAQAAKLEKFKVHAILPYDPTAKALSEWNPWGAPDVDEPRLFVWFGPLKGAKRYLFRESRPSFSTDFVPRGFDEDFAETYVSRSARPISYFLERTGLTNNIRQQIEATAAKKRNLQSGNVLFLLWESGFDSSRKVPNANPEKTLYFVGSFDNPK